VLKDVVGKYPGLPVIVLTGHGTIEDAVSAMRMGAFDFVTKPINLDHISLLVKRALESRELARKKLELEAEVEAQRRISSIIGSSSGMKKVLDLVRRVSATKASVLITGESGVGKELVADAIHNLSPRADHPLVKVHCAALAESLLESELFGHEKGAFTGALARKRGRFELADKGTLFLDEIGEINQNVQIKILRVLQERKFERVGGEETIEVDVRIIAATNRDLKEEIKKGAFREDLYYASMSSTSTCRRSAIAATTFHSSPWLF
jgi:DNA-binding NtrC family response regulator